MMKLRDQGSVTSDTAYQALYDQIPYGFLYAYNPDYFRNRSSAYPNLQNQKLYFQMTGIDGDFNIGGDVGRFDFRDKLKGLKMPVLIYGGRYDRVAVPEMMIKYREYCPQARFVMFEYSGHNPQMEEPAALFAR